MSLWNFFHHVIRIFTKKVNDKKKFLQKEVPPSNPNFHNAVVGASKNHHKWNLKFDIQMKSHSIVEIINYKTDLKFCLTIATKRSHKDK